MAIAKWADPGTRSSNLAGTALNSLANGSHSAGMAYDNSTSRDLYAMVTVKLGSITPTTNGHILLRVFVGDGTDTPDDTSAQGGGEVYAAPLTTSASAKVVVFPMVRLYPGPMRLHVTNQSGVAFAASGNELYVRPFNEDVT